MQFNIYSTMYQRYKKSEEQLTRQGRPHKPLKGLREFYHGSVKRTMEVYAETHESYLPVSINHLASEVRWYGLGRPYYNFHPNLVPVFGRSKLNFPCSYLELPYHTMVVQFADKDPNLMLPDGKHYVKSVMVSRCVGSTNLPGEPQRVLQKNYDQHFGMWLEIGEEVETSYGTDYVFTYRHISWERDDTTIEEAMTFLPDDENVNEGVQVGKPLTDLVLKLVVSIAFLSRDDSSIILPHVLKRDEREYYQGNEEIRKRLVKKARDTRDQIGYLVGSREMFDLGFIGPPAAQSSPTGEVSERDIQYANIVSGHWQLFRYGPKREQGRMRWVMPYVRNKEKPFKHSED